MAFSPRSITLIGSLFGGGCGLVPFLSWSGSNKGLKPVEDTVSAPAPAKNLITSPSPAEPLVTPAIPDSNKVPTSETQRRENKGNCVVEKEASEKLGDVLWLLVSESDSYTTITCREIRSNTSTQLPSHWIGLFHEDLLNRNSSLGPGTKFDIKTETTDLNSDNYQTIFSGSVIRGSSITGTWKEKSDEMNDQDIKVINVTSSNKKIYITAK